MRGSTTMLTSWLKRGVCGGDRQSRAPKRATSIFEFKLEGSNGDDFDSSNGNASNALRQKLKRLLAKLRRLAR
jgi:hypothetical protein